MLDKLVLFDIDLTMIKSNGSGLKAMEQYFRDFTGHEGEVHHTRPDGKSDRWIVAELFRINGKDYDESLYEKFMAGYFEILEEHFAKENSAMLLPGVRELIDTIEKRDDLYLALVTGNDERGARIKLAPFGLNETFPVGGFGCDSILRADLIPLAIQRADRHYGRLFIPGETIMIGDSENDVHSSNMAGVNCIAVATGIAQKEDLEATGDCRIVDDLGDTGSIMNLIDNFRE